MDMKRLGRGKEIPKHIRGYIFLYTEKLENAFLLIKSLGLPT